MIFIDNSSALINSIKVVQEQAIQHKDNVTIFFQTRPLYLAIVYQLNLDLLMAIYYRVGLKWLFVSEWCKKNRLSLILSIARIIKFLQ